MPLIVWDGREDAKLSVEVRVDGHDGRHIATPVAVVRSRPNGHNGLFGEMVLPRGLAGMSELRVPERYTLYPSFTN